MIRTRWKIRIKSLSTITNVLPLMVLALKHILIGDPVGRIKIDADVVKLQGLQRGRTERDRFAFRGMTEDAVDGNGLQLHARLRAPPTCHSRINGDQTAGSCKPEKSALVDNCRGGGLALGRRADQAVLLIQQLIVHRILWLLNGLTPLHLRQADDTRPGIQPDVAKSVFDDA